MDASPRDSVDQDWEHVAADEVQGKHTVDSRVVGGERAMQAYGSSVAQPMPLKMAFQPPSCITITPTAFV